MARTKKAADTTEEPRERKKIRFGQLANVIVENEMVSAEERGIKRETDPRHEVRLRLEKRFPRNLHKEHWQEGEVEKDKKKRGPKRTKTAEPDLRSTLYYWWWKFQKAAQDFPQVREDVMAESEGHARAVKRNDRYFGELGDDFLRWWEEGGKAIFSEMDIPLLQVVAPQTLDQEFLAECGVILVIPVTIAREIIHKQLDEVLDVYHPGDKLKRHRYSTADRPIYSEHRYRTTKFDLLLAVWQRKEESLKDNTDDSWWEIYCDATGDKQLKAKLEGNNAINVGDKIYYAKRAKEAYVQAKELIRNAIIGQFPKDDEFQARKKRAKGPG